MNAALSGVASGPVDPGPYAREYAFLGPEGLDVPAVERALAPAVERFGLADVLVVHRHGRIAVGEPIMMVATAAPYPARLLTKVSW